MNTRQGDHVSYKVFAHVARSRSASFIEEWSDVDPGGHDIPTHQTARVGLVVTIAIEADGDMATRHFDHRRGPQGTYQATLIDWRRATFRRVRCATHDRVAILLAQRIIAAKRVNKGGWPFLCPRTVIMGRRHDVALDEAGIESAAPC